jgi:hypothetical protein
VGVTHAQRRMLWIALALTAVAAVLAAIGGTWVIAAPSLGVAALAATQLYRDEATRDRPPTRRRH